MLVLIGRLSWGRCYTQSNVIACHLAIPSDFLININLVICLVLCVCVDPVPCKEEDVDVPPEVYVQEDNLELGSYVTVQVL